VNQADHSKNPLLARALDADRGGIVRAMICNPAQP
jgi:hypothetical protein